MRGLELRFREVLVRWWGPGGSQGFRKACGRRTAGVRAAACPGGHLRSTSIAKVLCWRTHTPTALEDGICLSAFGSREGKLASISCSAYSLHSRSLETNPCAGLSADARSHIRAGATPEAPRFGLPVSISFHNGSDLSLSCKHALRRAVLFPQVLFWSSRALT